MHIQKAISLLRRFMQISFMSLFMHIRTAVLMSVQESMAAGAFRKANSTAQAEIFPASTNMDELNPINSA